MTFVNWISVGIVGIILLAGILLRVYYRKRLRDLDGFMGIISDEPDKEEDDSAQDARSNVDDPNR